MTLLTIIIIALGLSMDAFAVSVAGGFQIVQLKIKHAVKIALYFGIFQAIMLILGWLAGFKLKDLISGVDHWVAFGILLVIGLKMIYESRKIEKEEKGFNPDNIYMMLFLSVATSIDALAVGLSLSFINVQIITPAIIIGIVTFIVSFAGVFIGKKMGHFFESKLELIGGLVLIGIGIKILAEHLLDCHTGVL